MSSELGVTTCLVMEVKVDSGALPYLRIDTHTCTQCKCCVKCRVASLGCRRCSRRTNRRSLSYLWYSVQTFASPCSKVPSGGEHCTGLYSTVRYCMVLLYSAVQYGEVLHGIVVSTLPEAPPRGLGPALWCWGSSGRRPWRTTAHGVQWHRIQMSWAMPNGHG